MEKSIDFISAYICLSSILNSVRSITNMRSFYRERKVRGLELRWVQPFQKWLTGTV